MTVVFGNPGFGGALLEQVVSNLELVLVRIEAQAKETFPQLALVTPLKVLSDLEAMEVDLVARSLVVVLAQLLP
uniref:Uncharacterized protein n=1 Tax=Ditylenchus dipsaci TaxID=166011 RepID=A0A915CST6_9BILA